MAIKAAQAKAYLEIQKKQAEDRVRGCIENLKLSAQYAKVYDMDSIIAHAEQVKRAQAALDVIEAQIKVVNEIEE